MVIVMNCHEGYSRRYWDETERQTFRELVKGVLADPGRKIDIISLACPDDFVDDASSSLLYTDIINFPFPNSTKREEMIRFNIKNAQHSLTDDDITELVRRTEDYTLYDLRTLIASGVAIPRNEKYSLGRFHSALRSAVLSDFERIIDHLAIERNTEETSFLNFITELNFVQKSEVHWAPSTD